MDNGHAKEGGLVYKECDLDDSGQGRKKRLEKGG